MKNEEAEPKTIEYKIAGVIAILLLTYGLAAFAWAIIWASLEPDTDKWFTRMSLSLICFGFSGVILRLPKK